MIKFYNGMPILIPNVIFIENEDFYVSYNKKDKKIYGSDTTAIVLADMSKFYILNGDHSKNLMGLNLNDCLEYFRKNIELKNFYSDDL